MESPNGEALLDGVRNLLFDCAEMTAGQSLFIVHEGSDEAYYDPGLLDAVAAAAQKLGIATETCLAPFSANVTDPDAALSARIDAADCTLFLARLGDQIRFRPSSARSTRVISYALDRGMMASSFGAADYQAFKTLKLAIDQQIAQAEDIHVTCPLGTDFRGRLHGQGGDGGDTTLKRFPMSVFKPVDAAGFSGQIAQAGFLVGTGSHYYEPYACPIRETLFIAFKGDRITGFNGDARDVEAATAHYETVADLYGIDAAHVHSWHAGIHPGCAVADPAAASFERWSGSAFGNPRLLHFHTCGAYPPGEISLNVVDPTVKIDGVAVWEAGVLHPERVPGGAALLNAHPSFAAAFKAPRREIGLGPNGRLCYDL